MSSSSKPPESLAPLLLRPVDAQAPPPEEPPARGEALLSLFSVEGAYLHDALTPKPPGSVVQPCIDGPDAGRPVRAGWLIFQVVLSNDQGDPPRVTFVESSPLLPQPLIACITHALSNLRTAIVVSIPTKALAYVSLR